MKAARQGSQKFKCWRAKLSSQGTNPKSPVKTRMLFQDGGILSLSSLFSHLLRSPPWCRAMLYSTLQWWGQTSHSSVPGRTPRSALSGRPLGVPLQMSPVRSPSGTPSPDVLEQDHPRSPHLLHQERLHGARREGETRGQGGHDGRGQEGIDGLRNYPISSRVSF